MFVCGNSYDTLKKPVVVHLPQKPYLAYNDKQGTEFIRQVIVYPGEDNYWVVECPSLPGCISRGKTKEEAISNIREAIQRYIAALEDDH